MAALRAGQFISGKTLMLPCAFPNYSVSQISVMCETVGILFCVGAPQKSAALRQRTFIEMHPTLFSIRGMEEPVVST